MSIALTSNTRLKDGLYRIKELLGQGSFGITYIALTKVITQGSLGRMEVDAKVAVKEFFMCDVNTREPEGTRVEGSTGNVFTNYRRKFKKEAQNLATLQHPNIVKVVDVFDENNTTYYVMELIEGMNLDDYIKSKGSLKEEEALKFIREVGEALQYMHLRKMLHLDIKPKNIMLRGNGECCVIDFGLSKQFNEHGEPESSTTIGLGTPGYAPIEQAKYRGEGAFPATLDVYALGATLFKMLTGHRPPDASDILNEGFPEDEFLGKNISSSTMAALQKAMDPKKFQRYQSVQEFLDDLEVGEPDTEIDDLEVLEAFPFDLNSNYGFHRENSRQERKSEKNPSSVKKNRVIHGQIPNEKPQRVNSGGEEIKNVGSQNRYKGKLAKFVKNYWNSHKILIFTSSIGGIIFGLLIMAYGVYLLAYMFAKIYAGSTTDVEELVIVWLCPIIAALLVILLAVYIKYKKKAFIPWILFLTGTAIGVGCLFFYLDENNARYGEYLTDWSFPYKTEEYSPYMGRDFIAHGGLGISRSSNYPYDYLKFADKWGNVKIASPNVYITDKGYFLAKHVPSVSGDNYYDVYDNDGNFILSGYPLDDFLRENLQNVYGKIIAGNKPIPTLEQEMAPAIETAPTESSLN